MVEPLAGRGCGSSGPIETSGVEKIGLDQSSTERLGEIPLFGRPDACGLRQLHQLCHVRIERSVESPLDSSCQRSLRTLRARHKDIELASIFIADFSRFVDITEDTLGDQHDQFCLANRAAFLLESVTDERNIAENRYLISGVVNLVLDQTSERERLAVVDLDCGLDSTLLDGRRIDGR